jgi:hypothetical protein
MLSDIMVILYGPPGGPAIRTRRRAPGLSRPRSPARPPSQPEAATVCPIPKSYSVQVRLGPSGARKNLGGWATVTAATVRVMF